MIYLIGWIGVGLFTLWLQRGYERRRFGGVIPESPTITLLLVCAGPLFLIAYIIARINWRG
jgi:hypothetical protein